MRIKLVGQTKILLLVGKKKKYYMVIAMKGFLSIIAVA